MFKEQTENLTSCLLTQQLVRARGRKHLGACALWRAPRTAHSLSPMRYIAGTLRRGVPIREALSEQGFVWARFDWQGKVDVVLAEEVGRWPLKEELHDGGKASETQQVSASWGLAPKVTEQKADYVARASVVLKEMKVGSLQKVVLARRESLAFAGSVRTVVQKFLTMAHLYPNAFVYLFLTLEECWMGASPELLLQVEGEKVVSHALAGTRWDKTGAWTGKERREHRFVLEALRAALSQHSRHLSESESTWESAEKDLYHIKTRLEGRVLKGALNAGALLEKMHPSPALCGMPRARAMRCIQDNEPFDRTHYAGFLGPVGEEGELELYVNLRCGRVYSDGVCLFAGAGLVSESEPEKEWLETEQKLNTMRRLFL